MNWLSERTEYEIWFTLLVLGLIATGVTTLVASWLRTVFTTLVRKKEKHTHD